MPTTAPRRRRARAGARPSGAGAAGRRADNARRDAAADPSSRGARRFLAGLLAGAAVTGVLAAVVLGGTPDAGDPVEARASELAAEFAARDAEVLADLTGRAEAAVDPVLAALAALGTGQVAQAADDGPSAAGAARTALAPVADAFAPGPSAGTAINLARESFDLALAQVATAADLAAAGADQASIDAAAALAVRSWSVGASQLDLAHVEAGEGHRHVFLPLHVPGALTADG